MRRLSSGVVSFRVSLLIVCFSFGVVTIAPLCSAQNPHAPMPVGVPQSQDPHLGIGRPNTTADGVGEMPGVPAATDVQKQQAIAASRQRQIELRRDTEKMLQLTMELKDDLQQADRVLSVDAIRKAQQIEKLAKSVRSKMKNSL